MLLLVTVRNENFRGQCVNQWQYIQAAFGEKSVNLLEYCNERYLTQMQRYGNRKGQNLLFFILIPCIIDYVEINQLNALNYILLYFYFTMAPTKFRQKNAILRERLCSFLSHFSVNMLRDVFRLVSYHINAEVAQKGT
jgi:hypothetical protein